MNVPRVILLAGAIACGGFIGICGPAHAENAAPPQAAAPVKEVAPNKTIALLGATVIGPLGQEVGRVVDVLVGDKGIPQAAVIDFGGFLGVGTRKIAVQWNTLHFNPGDAKYPVVLDLLPDQLKSAPNYKGQTKPAPVVTPPWEEPSKPAPEAAGTASTESAQSGNQSGKAP